FQAHQRVGFQTGDQHIAFPLRELVAGVEGETRGGQRGHPFVHRLFHALFVGTYAAGDLAAAVVFTVGDHRPTIILARLIQIDLVAALRTVLTGPQLVGDRVQSRALHIAVADGPDFRQGAGGVHEGVVLGHAAV